MAAVVVGILFILLGVFVATRAERIARRLVLNFLKGRTTRRMYKIPDDETPEGLLARDTGPGLRLLGTAAAALLIAFGLILIFEH